MKKILTLTLAAVSAIGLSAQVPSGGKKISNELIGIFFEDISSAADGGLCAERLQNGAFEYSPIEKDGWGAVSKLYLKPSSVLYTMTSAFAAILITVNRAMSMHLIVNDFFIFRCFFANRSLLTVNKKDCMHTKTKNVEPVLSLVPRS